MTTGISKEKFIKLSTQIVILIKLVKMVFHFNYNIDMKIN